MTEIDKRFFENKCIRVLVKSSIRLCIKTNKTKIQSTKAFKQVRRQNY